MGAITDAMDKGKFDHATGDLTTAETLVKTFAKGCMAIRVFNRSNTYTVLMSFDGGTTFLAILPNGVREDAYHGNDLRLKTLTGTATYDAEWVENQ